MSTQNKDMQPVQPKASGRRYVIVDGQGKERSNIELAGLPIKINNETLKDPNVIAAIQNYEQRRGRQIIGVTIKAV